MKDQGNIETVKALTASIRDGHLMALRLGLTHKASLPDTQQPY